MQRRTLAALAAAGLLGLSITAVVAQNYPDPPWGSPWGLDVTPIPGLRARTQPELTCRISSDQPSLGNGSCLLC
jgi:hypothetical protein